MKENGCAVIIAGCLFWAFIAWLGRLPGLIAWPLLGLMIYFMYKAHKSQKAKELEAQAANEEWVHEKGVKYRWAEPSEDDKPS